MNKERIKIRRVGVQKDLISALRGDKSGQLTTSIRLQQEAKQDLALAVVEAGYGLKGKSRWINDVTTEFLTPDFLTPGARAQIIKFVSQSARPARAETVRINREVWEKAWWESIKVATLIAEDDDLFIEPAVSLVIRSAITWKLGLREMRKVKP